MKKKKQNSCCIMLFMFVSALCQCPGIIMLKLDQILKETGDSFDDKFQKAIDETRFFLTESITLENSYFMHEEQILILEEKIIECCEFSNPTISASSIIYATGDYVFYECMKYCDPNFLSSSNHPTKKKSKASLLDHTYSNSRKKPKERNSKNQSITDKNMTMNESMSFDKEHIVGLYKEPIKLNSLQESMLYPVDKRRDSLFTLQSDREQYDFNFRDSEISISSPKNQTFVKIPKKRRAIRVDSSKGRNTYDMKKPTIRNSLQRSDTYTVKKKQMCLPENRRIAESFNKNDKFNNVKFNTYNVPKKKVGSTEIALVAKTCKNGENLHKNQQQVHSKSGNEREMAYRFELEKKRHAILFDSDYSETINMCPVASNYKNANFQTKDAQHDEIKNKSEDEIYSEVVPSTSKRKKHKKREYDIGIEDKSIGIETFPSYSAIKKEYDNIDRVSFSHATSISDFQLLQPSQKTLKDIFWTENYFEKKISELNTSGSFISNDEESFMNKASCLNCPIYDKVCSEYTVESSNASLHTELWYEENKINYINNNSQRIREKDTLQPNLLELVTDADIADRKKLDFYKKLKNIQKKRISDLESFFRTVNSSLIEFKIGKNGTINVSVCDLSDYQKKILGHNAYLQIKKIREKQLLFFLLNVLHSKKKKKKFYGIKDKINNFYEKFFISKKKGSFSELENEYKKIFEDENHNKFIEFLEKLKNEDSYEYHKCLKKMKNDSGQSVMTIASVMARYENVFSFNLNSTTKKIFLSIVKKMIEYFRKKSVLSGSSIHSYYFDQILREIKKFLDGRYKGLVLYKGQDGFFIQKNYMSACEDDQKEYLEYDSYVDDVICRIEDKTKQKSNDLSMMECIFPLFLRLLITVDEIHMT